MRPARKSDLAALDVVLRDSRFHPARPPWAFITDALNALYQRFVTWLGNATVDNTTSSGVFAVVLVFLIGLFAFLVARGAAARLVADHAVDRPEALPATSAGASQLAEAAAAAGEYRNALRYLFRATLLALQERELVELRPGLTNREYLRALRLGAGASHAALAGLIDLFDVTWYGHRPVTASDYSRAQHLARHALDAEEPAA
jgi:hypothetical protein